MTDIEKLKEIIDEIDIFIDQKAISSAPEFIAWKTKVECLLVKKYGKDSIQYQRFIKTSFFDWFDKTDREKIDSCKKGLETTKATFIDYLRDLEDESASTISVNTSSQKYVFDRIFIVHGHDGERKESVARIIEKQGIEAIILSEKANQGRTIIEKFENYSDVGGAICLFTADDIGNVKTADEYNPRARQNVVFETGYFMGKLGRDHIVILADKGVEMPSDLSGVVHTDTASWQVDLLKDLKVMGYAVDANKLF